MCKFPIALYIAMIVTSFAITILPARAEARAVRGCWASLRAYDAGVFYPPQPILYSVWYYALYEPFCAGKPKGACDWEVRCDSYQRLCQPQ
jgi:hypothetical protein